MIKCCFKKNSSILADYLHICRRSNPDIPKCIIDSAYFLRTKLAEGKKLILL